MEHEKNKLPRKMKTWRKSKKLTITELAECLGLSIGYISMIERGVLPVSLRVFKKYHLYDPVSFPKSDAENLI